MYSFTWKLLHLCRYESAVDSQLPNMKPQALEERDNDRKQPWHLADFTAVSDLCNIEQYSSRWVSQTPR